jgi:hypothetical protein
MPSTVKRHSEKIKVKSSLLRNLHSGKEMIRRERKDEIKKGKRKRDIRY